mmetsp:Transcript_12568/g.18761  ORF Transcript_12568/g.18761 Transcript_12568/m.18761 type:complete len:241 (+) Transcript_12568:188-910(+)
MIESLNCVCQNHIGAQCNHQTFNGITRCVDDMGRILENVGPNIVQKMDQSIFASQSCHTKCEVLHTCAASLSMNCITIHQSIFEKWCHGIDVILAHLSNVLKHEAESLEHSILNVHFWNTILIHECWEDCEGTTSLSDDGNGNGGTHSHLAVLHLQVIEQCVQNVLWTNSLGYVSKSANCSSANCLLVGFEQLQQLKANAHPLLGRHKFSPTIGNASNQVNTIFLDFFVTIPQNRSQSGE